MDNKVDRSIEAPGGGACVDIFQRPDGSWGFEEYRRDPEDGRGWYRIGHFGDARFESGEAALDAAQGVVGWLPEVLS
ncbi:MAG: hypothetical protein AAGD13_19590 [Pseudomonadota bacterium]